MARKELALVVLCTALSCGAVLGVASVRAVARTLCGVGHRLDPVTETCSHGAIYARFRWPAAGRIVTSTCAPADGAAAAGITLALSRGAEIYAVESGRVAYAGNKLKGFDDLVLIRHDGGWVSAYGLIGAMLVKRNDVVMRGQVIARAGTDAFGSNKLHFELRHGAITVDPMIYLKKTERLLLSGGFCGS